MLGLNIYGGALLAEITLHVSSSTSFHPRQRSILAFSLTTLGLFFCGFPESNWAWTSWSKGMASLGWFILPQSADQYRYWPSIGVQLLSLGVILSPTLQRFLSHRYFTWLGAVSFPIYLIHGPLMRSMLVWLLFGFRKPMYLYTKNLDGTVADMWEVIPMPTTWMYVLALPIFFTALFLISHCWNIYVEPWCAWLTTRAEEIMCGDEPKPKEYDSGPILGNGSIKFNGVLPH